MRSRIWHFTDVSNEHWLVWDSDTEDWAFCPVELGLPDNAFSVVGEVSMHAFCAIMTRRECYVLPASPGFVEAAGGTNHAR